MADKKKQTEELKDKDLDKVQGGITSSGYGTNNIKKPGADPLVMGKGPNPPKFADFQDGED